MEHLVLIRYVEMYTKKNALCVLGRPGIRRDRDWQDRDDPRLFPRRGQTVRGIQLLGRFPPQGVLKVPQGSGKLRGVELLRRVPQDRCTG